MNYPASLKATFAVFAAAVAVTITAVVGVTTHESHMRELEVVNACVHTDRSAAECRVIVKGAP